jgi:acetaldehyde dehydrogenase/alcohol dehydrogenase
MPDEKAKLEKFIFVTAHGETCSGAKLNPNVVGRSAQWIAHRFAARDA